MKRSYKRRLIALIITALIGSFAVLLPNLDVVKRMTQESQVGSPPTVVATGDAATALSELEVKGRAPKTGYDRSQFGDGWERVNGCDMRNIILKRDLINTVVNDRCQVLSGSLNDPYTGTTIMFERGETTSDDVQIDHVVALSDAWQKGAQQLSQQQRVALANDPLELLAVDGLTNQQKSDSDAGTWLPPRKEFRCEYVARQIAVKKKYTLWVTAAEKDAMTTVLASCADQKLPTQ